MRLIFVLTILSTIPATKGELYSSVDKLARWSPTDDSIVGLLQDDIDYHMEIIAKIETLKSVLTSIDQTNHLDQSSTNNQDVINWMSNSSMLNPVYAFITMRKVSEAVEDLLNSVSTQSDDCDPSKGFLYEMYKLQDSGQLPSEADLEGCGDAILRLQVFYDLRVDDIITGNLSRGLSSATYKTLMSADDCFRLGKIAYHKEQLSLALVWFEKALEMCSEADCPSIKPELYDYSAFSAYGLGRVEYASSLTQLWLRLEPSNERAIENLEYYREELASHQTHNSTETYENHKTIVESDRIKYFEDEHVHSVADYDITQDEVVRNLCTKKDLVVPQGSCMSRQVLPGLHLEPELRIELLNSVPKVFRIYNFITNEEANYFRRYALPDLERSTIHLGQGFQPSHVRVAKTAWLPSKHHEIVDRVETRIRNLLDLETHDTEALQVVNYGVGGFYGPHTDAAAGEVRIDRYATILMYLNEVEAGGATIFPRLGIRAEPIALSALVWFNTEEYGTADERMLHSACPVLLGSKWIATKWISLKSNVFMRPCGRRNSSGSSE